MLRLISFLLLIPLLVSGSVILPDTSIETISLNSYAYSTEGLVGKVILSAHLEKLQIENDSIILVLCGRCDNLDFLDAYIAKKPLSILYYNKSSRKAGWFMSSREVINNVKYSVYEITGEDATSISTGTLIRLTANENKYTIFFDSLGMMLLNLIMGFVTSFGLILGFYKLLVFCRRKKFSSASIIHLGIAFLLVSFILMGVYLVDPLFARKFYTYRESEGLIIIFSGFLAVSTSIIDLFWLRKIDKAMTNVPWRSLHYYLFVSMASGVSVIILVLGFINLYRTLPVLDIAILANIFFLLLGSAEGAFAIKLLVRLKSRQDLPRDKVLIYRKLGIEMVLSGIVCIGYMVSGMVVMSIPYVSPQRLIANFLVHIFAALIGAFHIDIIPLPKVRTLNQVEMNVPEGNSIRR